MAETKAAEDMTSEELETVLRKKKEKERKELERKKKEYLEKRDILVLQLNERAVHLHKLLQEFKTECSNELQEHRELLDDYGKLRGNSKGGFSLESSDGKLRVSYKHRALGMWDERAGKAEELLKAFLADTVKKKDKDSYELILSLLEKNRDGHFEYSRIQTLYKHEDRFKDERWKEAIRLLKESYNVTSSKYDIYFQVRGEDDAWETVNLNFSSL